MHYILTSLCLEVKIYKRTQLSQTMDLEPDTPASQKQVCLKHRLLNISLALVFDSTQISILYVSPMNFFIGAGN